MDLADGGDLQKKIDNAKKKGQLMPEKEVWRYFIQIVTGLEALHNLKIVHRDIKCANLFLTVDGVLKLGDLNVSKVNKRGLLHTQTGTPYYASPEVWQDKPYDAKSDIWSIGCVLYEMCAQVPPFRAPDMKGLYTKVIRGVYPPLPSVYSSDLSMIVKMLLQVNPANRPSCTKILNLDKFKNNLSDTLIIQMDALSFPDQVA
jgi:NIMA (never in mitosis gene a)-related kinase